MTALAGRPAERLADVGAALSDSLDPGVVGRVVVTTAARLLEAERAAVYRLTAGAARLERVAVHGPAGDWTLAVEAGSGPAGRAVRERQVVVTPNVLDDPDTRWTAGERAGAALTPCRAALAAPLVARGEVIGALVVRAETGRAFSPDDVELALGLASHAAIALDNARLHAELRAAYEDLSRTQHQLAAARQLETLGRLAGGVAHHFNNLLAVITSRCHMMLWATVRQDPHRAGLEQIRRTAEQAAELTGQLLAFGQGQVMRPRRLDVNVTVAGLVGLLRPLAGARVEVDFALEAAPAYVVADPAQIESVLVTLVAYARDTMPDGGRVVIATARHELASRPDLELPAGPYVALTVDDTGRGLDADTRARIFEPFSGPAGVSGGSGLRLASVYGTVRQSGGGIEVDGEPGRGTRFTIYLPAC